MNIYNSQAALVLFKFMKKGNLSSVKPSQLRNLSRVTTFSDTVYFSFIFSRFPSFLLSFHYISIFLILSKQIVPPEYFPPETIFSNVFTKILETE